MCRPGPIARAIAALLVVSASAGAASAPAGAVEDLVDPLIGSAGKGSCMPGPCLPHASIYPSPDTLRPTPGGYRDGADIVGFAQLHTQGTGGTPSYGNFLISRRARSRSQPKPSAPRRRPMKLRGPALTVCG